MTTEQWRDVLGFEGRYQVSNKGRVKSVPFMQRYLLRTGAEAYRLTRERILAQQKQNSGYLLVHLHRDSKRKAYTVHRLVAAAFVPGEGETVNHIDGIKTNNCAVNLEWVSYAENHLHAVRIGLNPRAIAVVHPLTGERFPSISQASKTAHVDHNKISREWDRT